MSKPPLVEQPSWPPTRKVNASVAGAAIGTFLADLAVQAWAAFPPSGEYAIVIVLTLAFGYFVKERADEPVGVTGYRVPGGGRDPMIRDDG